MSSPRTAPESLKLNVWSKSEATRKCFGVDVIVMAFHGEPVKTL